MAKFGASFAVANRLEELCGHFGTHLLMDREVAKNQQGFDRYLVNIAKVSLTSVEHPMNIFTLYMPGIHNCPQDIDETRLLEFISVKNQAMEYFVGNQLLGLVPDFPRVREELLQAQNLFRALTAKEDLGIARILEYIRETPLPAKDFTITGMKLLEKKRDSLGERLFHLSKQLLQAMNPEFYHALVVDTEWEKFFKLEWRKKGETIIQIGSAPDGIYYLDSGTAKTVNGKGEILSSIESGMIFGEMAYFGGEQRRTATVLAKTNVVLRKISTEDFHKLPVIIKIVEHIAMARRREIAAQSGRPEDRATALKVVAD
jgi:CRP-like cAMP-binding protein